MPRRRTIPEKLCPECRRPFKPHTMRLYLRPEGCCSRQCSSKRHFRKNGQAMIRASCVARRKALRAHVEASVWKQYGELSVREIELFNLGHKVGFDRGYQIAYQRQRRQEAKRVA